MFMLLFRKQLRQQLSTRSKKSAHDNPNKRDTRVAKQRVTPTQSEVSMFDLHDNESGEIGTDHEFTLWDESADM